MSTSPREQDALEYATAEARRRAQSHRDDAGLGEPRSPASSVRQPLYRLAAVAVRDQLRAEPHDPAVAVSVAQQMLAAYGRIGYSDVGMLAQAHGALAESLRIVLRALGAEPDAEKGSSVVRTPGGDQRCPAAHHDDPTPCSGPTVVTVLDAHNAGVNGCEHHAARVLASLTGGRVYGLPDAPAGAAIRVFRAAGTLRPFCWTEDSSRSRPDQLSHEENRRRGDGR